MTVAVQQDPLVAQRRGIVPEGGDWVLIPLRIDQLQQSLELEETEISKLKVVSKSPRT